MLWYTYCDHPQVPIARLGRFLELREQQRTTIFSSLAKDTNENTELENPENDSLETPNEEIKLEGAAPALDQESERASVSSVMQRLLVVANRLQVSAVRRGEESWSLEISAGGLVSALLGVKDFDILWIGWPGVNVPDDAGRKSLTKLLAEKKSIPVFLDEEIYNPYYNGYCNNILWPLFHYLGHPKEDRLATTRSFQSQFDAYKKANQMFADVVIENYQEGDIVWCQDYHLMFLPKYLKEYDSNIKVGWFLHTPFPSSEIHRTLPSRSEVLHAVLAADLVGFQTYDYARHFLSACTRILGLECNSDGVEDQGRLTHVAAFPIGINPERFMKALENPMVQNEIKDLKRFAGKKVLLGVDRLDMIKGIPQKLLAFEKFLDENPEWCEKVVLAQIAVPTRTEVPEYQKLASEVHEIVGRINGRFGTLTAVPIHHLDCSLTFTALCALYAITDVALVTSLRDGMNLVSYEFVACQNSKKGVLILSELAGAAQSLGAGAILVNPWNVTEVASAIGQALNMPAEEREKRHRLNFKHVTTHTSQQWAEYFVSELDDTVIEAQKRTREVARPLVCSKAIERYVQSKNRLLILGFNAALTEPIESPGRKGGTQITELQLKLHPDLQEPLRILSSDPNTIVVILSGSGRTVLDDNFGRYEMWLAAENGMFIRSTKGNWMTSMNDHLNLDWMDSVKRVFEYFTVRTPRSCFNRRETSLVWNYNYSDISFGRIQARDMLEHLWTGPISNTSVDVVQGNRSVEVRPFGVTKGTAIVHILGEIMQTQPISVPIDYVLCVGHFLKKDEEIYTFFEAEEVPSPNPTSVLRSKRPAKVKHLSSKSQDQKFSKINTDVLDLKEDNYFPCAVGRTCTKARYMLNSSDDVVQLLKDMADAADAASLPLMS